MNADATIAVDIGNTAIKLGWFPEGPQASLHRAVAMNQPGLTRELIEAVPREHPKRLWLISSVSDSALRTLRNLINTEFPQDYCRVLCHRDVPLGMSVRHPERVGVDRILGAWQATTFLTSPNVIAIDIGSAVTVDLVVDRQFLGGAIFPGARLQLRALHAGTDQLPEAFMPNIGKQYTRLEVPRLEVPGKETVTAIQCGVSLGIAGAIDRLIETYRSAWTTELPVMLTGGDAFWIQPHLYSECTLVKDAVLEGILNIADELRLE